MLALVAASVLVGAALELVPPLVIRRVVDDHLSLGRPDGLLLLAALYLGAIALVQAMSFATDYLTAIIAQHALHRLRMRLFSYLQRLPLGYYDRTPMGDVISRCTADVETVGALFSSGGAGGSSGATVMTDLVRLLTISIAMVALSPILFLITLAIILPLIFVTRYFQVRVRHAERANRLAVGLQNAHLQETLTGVAVIRALGREAAFVARFRRALHQGLMAFNRATVYAATYLPIVNILAALATAIVLWMGAADVLTSFGITLGTLIAFVLLFQRFVQPITNLGNEWQTVQAALSGLERIFQVLALSPEDVPATPQRQAGPLGGAAIEMQDVVFGYLPDVVVLRRISMAVQSGEHVALVGRTGAGKSSVLHLLGGLYAPWSGAVRVSGADPRLLSESQRRRVIGVVPQVVQLFSGTVYENLAMGDGSVPRDAVTRAAIIAGAGSFIKGLPQGFDTILGKGTQLSAGQHQLIALARALVWEPSVLLLDEATAAVDSATEAAFRSALRTYIAERRCAVLTVAHRLATAREANRVLVMDAGQIVEEGPPEELARLGGRFAALLELEAAGWNWQTDGNSARSTPT
jgi:ATP-binding cassette subfamily B multidrug efflux pump